MRGASKESDSIRKMNFLSLSSLGIAQESKTRDGPEQVENINALKDKIRSLDKTLGHMTDMLGAIKSQTGAKNMVVDMGGEVFKMEGGSYDEAEPEVASGI
eukprot:13274286-Ditylum_brightwellii.AAC.1